MSQTRRHFLATSAAAAGIVTSVAGRTALALVKRKLEDDVALETEAGVRARIVT